VFRRKALEFHKSSQLFIRAHNETLSVIAAIMVGIIRSIGGYKPLFPIPEKPSAFIRVHNEPLSVVAMRVRNPDRSPVGING
jgi:hypothetical protein